MNTLEEKLQFFVNELKNHSLSSDELLQALIADRKKIAGIFYLINDDKKIVKLKEKTHTISKDIKAHLIDFRKKNVITFGKEGIDNGSEKIIFDTIDYNVLSISHNNYDTNDPSTTFILNFSAITNNDVDYTTDNSVCLYSKETIKESFELFRDIVKQEFDNLKENDDNVEEFSDMGKCTISIKNWKNDICSIIDDIDGDFKIHEKDKDSKIAERVLIPAIDNGHNELKNVICQNVFLPFYKKEYENYSYSYEVNPVLDASDILEFYVQSKKGNMIFVGIKDNKIFTEGKKREDNTFELIEVEQLETVSVLFYKENGKVIVAANTMSPFYMTKELADFSICESLLNNVRDDDDNTFDFNRSSPDYMWYETKAIINSNQKFKELGEYNQRVYTSFHLEPRTELTKFKDGVIFNTEVDSFFEDWLSSCFSFELISFYGDSMAQEEFNYLLSIDANFIEKMTDHEINKDIQLEAKLIDEDADETIRLNVEYQDYGKISLELPDDLADKDVKLRIIVKDIL